MQNTFKHLLQHLETFGQTHDAQHTERAQRMLNITRDTGELLNVLVRAMRATRILEIGTSNGYSTLWLAHAAQATQGHVTTLDLSEYKHSLATSNFEQAGLNALISPILAEAGQHLRCMESNSVDFLFLDSERSEYPAWWPHIQRILRPNGLLVVDNALSHPQEMKPFIELVTNTQGFTCTTLPVGNGEFLATKT